MFRSEVSTQQDIAIRMLIGILTKRDIAVSLECYYRYEYMDTTTTNNNNNNQNSLLIYQESYKSDVDSWNLLRPSYSKLIAKIVNLITLTSNSYVVTETTPIQLEQRVSRVMTFALLYMCAR